MILLARAERELTGIRVPVHSLAVRAWQGGLWDLSSQSEEVRVWAVAGELFGLMKSALERRGSADGARARLCVTCTGVVKVWLVDDRRRSVISELGEATVTVT